MQSPWFFRSALVSVLVASGSLAGEPDGKTGVRTLVISEHPADATHRVYVSGQVATVLRFEQEVNPAKTKLLGWEGRFEPPLVGSKKVVLEPLRDLSNDERVPLVVTLVDGTELPFLVSPPSRERRAGTDHQVNVFKSHENCNAMRSSLVDSLLRERKLSEELDRFRNEEKSVDHALATLLANGESKKTPFLRRRTALLKHEDMDMKIEVFAGPGKAAVVVQLTNTDYPEPWRFRDARLSADFSSSTARPFALRMDRAEIVPGQSGRLAVVADESAFTSKQGLINLALEIFRQDGLQQVVVELEHTLLLR